MGKCNAETDKDYGKGFGLVMLVDDEESLRCAGTGMLME